MAFHVFRHVEAEQFDAQDIGQLACHFGFSNAGAYQEHVVTCGGSMVSTSVPGLELRVRPRASWERGRKIDIYYRGVLRLPLDQESLRAEREKARADAQEASAKREKARAKREKARADERDARVKQEAARADEQKARADEEKARADEEKACTKRETARADEQDARAKRETARADEEKARADRLAEMLRALGMDPNRP